MEQRPGFPASYLAGASPSFADLLHSHGHTVALPEGAAGPYGTTIVAAKYVDGVVMAGDRRATMGHVIALHDVRKVFGADEESIIGIAGSAGVAMELVKLFQVELEHFEKVEGARLSFDGKANRLGALLRSNLPQAMQGLSVLPLFVGWDVRAGTGRMFTYDATGGRYEESRYAALGSGASFARGALKKLHDPDADERSAVTVLLQSLFDAADDDAATGGLDLTRGVLPVVMRASAEGVVQWSEEGVREVAEEIVAARAERHDGPRGAAL